MNIKLIPIQTETLKNPNAHLFGEPEGELELVVFSAQVWVDGTLYGEASDCDMGRWIICDNVQRDWQSNEMGPLDGCYPANSVEALAYAMAECCTGVNHGDVTVAAPQVKSPE